VQKSVHLTRRANQGHTAIVANIRFIQPNPFHRIFCIPFTPKKKRLTRRANQGHNATIAKIVEPARRNPRRAFSLPSFYFLPSFSLASLFIGNFQIGRRPHVTTPHLPTPRRLRRQRAAVRTTSAEHEFAGTREPAGPRRGACCPPHAAPTNTG
jgi:hypothetical protein